MKNLILSLTLLVSSNLVGQEIQTYSTKTLWKFPGIGLPLQEITMTNDSMVIFSFQDLQYRHISSFETFGFTSVSEAEQFFLKVKELLDTPYSRDNYQYFQSNGVSVSRTANSFGIPTTMIRKGNSWCWMEGTKINRVLTSIQSVKS